jgi:L-xylulokinase
MVKGEKLETTYVSGGGSKSPLWCQILADCTGNRMRIAGGMDSGSRGAAMNAGVAVGVFSNHADAVQKMVKVTREHEPNKENETRYSQLYSLYLNLIQAAWPIWEQSYKAGVESWQ